METCTIGIRSKLIEVFLILSIIVIGKGLSESRDLYNSKVVKSDLKWTFSPSLGGWEELSGMDENGQTIRYIQVCNDHLPNQNNWARSPFINSEGAKRVTLEVEYSVVKCDTCRETFTLYYYSSSDDLASSTFPHWRENPYVKIDTVAASTRFDTSSQNKDGINIKTFSIGPLNRKGFYIAVQDQGACMSLMGIRVSYQYCPEVTYELSYFPETLPKAEVASLVPVSGKCVSNAVYSKGEIPKYRCNSNGEWKVPTGLCKCRAGFHANPALTSCLACEVGFYKSSPGNSACQRCPPNSTSHAKGASSCQCQLGYYRAEKDSMDQACTRPPSNPVSLTWELGKTSAKLRWSSPLNNGGRSDLYYSLTCSECDAGFNKCRPCPPSIRYHPRDHHHITQSSVNVENLEPFHYYKIRVSSHNGVSAVSGEQPNYEEVEFSTNKGVPSHVSSIHLISKSSKTITLAWAPSLQLPEKVTGYEVHAVPTAHRTGPISKSPHNIAPVLFKTTDTNITLTELYPSTEYQVKIRPQSLAGPGPYSDTLTFVTNPKELPPPTPAPQSDNMTLIIGVVVGLIVVIIFIIIVIVVFRRRQMDTIQKQNERARAKIVGNPDDQQSLTDSNGLIVRLPPLLAAATSGGNRTTYTDYRDPQKGVAEIAREIDYTNIKIERVIGQGEFGEVCRGKLIDGKREFVVAVKRLKRGATLIDQTNLLREACTMAQFKDPNILQLRGVVTKTMPIMIISDFMENGSLDKFLMANRGQFSVLQLVSMLNGIASGMRYLADMQYVHRDLAARNILVSSDLICKVSDFGLSRNLENDPHATYTTQGGKIPIRWTAPECFRYRRFTTASDVWSYGIVMWEVMSYGEKPYWDMTNEHVTDSIEDGFRLPAPQDCPQALHRLMLDCWMYDAEARPTFREIFVRMRRFTQQPDLLVDREPIQDASSAFLDPESPSDFAQPTVSMEEWLDVMKLGDYRQSFQDQGIKKLSEIVKLTPDDIERLGITQNVHRMRLQSGIQTLRRHMNNERNGSATLPMPNHPPLSPGVAMGTVPRGAVGVGPAGHNSNTVSYHQHGALNV